ncbi:MAG TPA: TIM-barrel domain-containing protein [Thermoleophilaceae bacterium]
MRAAAGCLLLLLLLPPAGADAASVDAGSLRAEVGADPWRLAFVDRSGRPVLGEAAGTGTGAVGALGFRTGAGSWFHATRVVSERRDGEAWLADVATSDPLGRRLSVSIAPDGDGIVRVRAAVEGGGADVAGAGIAFDAPAGERYLGFGERSNAVDQRGNEVESFVSDGPYQPEERAFIAAFVPPQGFHPRDDATYFPMPWLVSTRGYGFLVDNTETSRFRLGTEREDAWTVEVDAPEIVFRVFAGPDPAAVVRRLTGRIGRQPPVEPYQLGPWYQPRGDEPAQLDALIAADVPLSLAQTYTHYLPCGDHVARREADRARVRRFHDAGLAVTTYFNPMVCTDYEPVYGEGVAQGAFTRTRTGDPYTYKYTGSTVFLVAQVDFSEEPGRRFYAGLLGEALADGYDGWMEDFGEYTPPDSRSANGMDGAQMHNLYPVQYHCAAARAVQGRSPAPARFVRSGWTGVAPCAQVVWGGDPTTGWGFDGLRSVVHQGLGLGLSGIGRYGSDVGGFFALGANQLTPELLVRWIELGAVSGVMRTQANGFAVPERERPQISDPEVLPHWRRWAKLRTQLQPYLLGAEADYRRTGAPVMRHLALAYPADGRAAATDDAFLFGPDLLAAPVLEPGATTRSLYLPAGRWVDLWRSVAYDPRGGGLRLGRARVLTGARDVELPAPLAELPLLARAGTILPLLPPDVDTLTGYGSGRRQVRARDRRGSMRLLALPRGTSTARMGAGERLASTESRGGWRLTIRGRRLRRYALQASTSTLRRRLVPCGVSLAGRALPRRAWSYDRRLRVLRADFALRSGSLRVAACRR